MQLYQELLMITEKIEDSIKNDTFDTLASLQKKRRQLFVRIQMESNTSPPENSISLIRRIKDTEDRCVTLATTRKNHLATEMGATGRAKKLNNAYGRQLAY